MTGLFKPTKEEAKTAKNRKAFIIYEHEGRSVGATTNLSRKLKDANIERSNVNVLHGVPEGTMTLREVWELMVQEQKNKSVPVFDTDEDWERFLARHTSPDGSPQRIQQR
mgnify:CR=1 FL=1|tara:strand:+ start:1219 stop:1548 length:330 start_codon:yes stop_codon:yes gene_type:complete